MAECHSLATSYQLSKQCRVQGIEFGFADARQAGTSKFCAAN
jgi:hypothetical protein